METTGRFNLSALLVIVLAACALFTVKNIFLLLFIFGMIMVAITLRSLADRRSIWFELGMAALFCIFSVMSGGVLPFLIFYEVRISRRVQLILPSAMYLAYTLAFEHRSLPQIIICVLLLGALSAILYIIERISGRYSQMKGSISKSVSVSALGEMYSRQLSQELAIKNYLTAKNARLEERENISRSIHNSVGHSITAAIMTLEAADMLFDTSPERAREKMNTANDRIRTSLDTIRRAVRVLDNETANIPLSDLVSGLSSAADSFMMDTMRKVHMDFPPTEPELYIPHEHAEFLIGAAQELFSNGVRHGGADVFFMHLTADSSHIRLTVSDNGKSDYSPKNSDERIRSGFGLKKLISYAERCGGTAVFTNKNGFKSEIELLYEGG